MNPWTPPQAPQQPYPPPYAPYGYPAPPPRQGMSRTAIILIVVACLFVATCAGGVVALLAVSGSAEGGVRYANNMEAYATSRLSKDKVLEPGEKVQAYYDVTIALDGSEAALVTDRRVVYTRGTNVTSIPIGDITSVQRGDGAAGGDLFTVVGKDGTRIVIEIAPFNGGDGFYSTLESVRSAKK
jgi:hypothetical protein